MFFTHVESSTSVIGTAASIHDIDLVVDSPASGIPYSTIESIRTTVEINLGLGPISNAVRERPQDWKVCISWMLSTSEFCQNFMDPPMLPSLPPRNISNPQKYLFQAWIQHISSTKEYRIGLAALTKVSYMVDPRIQSHGDSIDVAISIISPIPGVAYSDSDEISPSLRLTLLNGDLADTIRSRPQEWNLCYSWGILGQEIFAYCSGIPELQELPPHGPVKVTTLERLIFKAWLLDTATAKTEAHVQ